MLLDEQMAEDRPVQEDGQLTHVPNNKAKDYTQNWSKNIQFHADKVLFPKSIAEVIEIVQNQDYTSLKAIGSRHCFNSIADTATSKPENGLAVHICMENMIQISVDTRSDPPTATFEAGVTFTQLMNVVADAGLALKNMPSLPHISVIGGVLTGTHGSGMGNTIIAKTIVGLEMVQANGDLVQYTSKGTPDFDHYLISVGALGIIVKVTMELEPHYNVAKGVYLDLPFQQFMDHSDDILGPGQTQNEFVSVFMDWKKPRMNSVWMGRKYTVVKPALPTSCYSAKHCPGTQFHPVPGQDPIACVHTGYGSWTGKVNHFLPDHPPSSAGNEIQAEYFVPYRHLKSAVQALWDIRHVFAHIVQITELRAIAQDNLPMSQAKTEVAGAIHFTLVKESTDVLNDLMGQVEEALKQFDYKVHLGKWFVCSGERLDEMYGEDLWKLRELIQRHDPSGRFRNEYIQKYILNNCNCN